MLKNFIRLSLGPDRYTFVNPDFIKQISMTRYVDDRSGSIASLDVVISGSEESVEVSDPKEIRSLLKALGHTKPVRVAK